MQRLITKNLILKNDWQFKLILLINSLQTQNLNSIITIIVSLYEFICRKKLDLLNYFCYCYYYYYLLMLKT